MSGQLLAFICIVGFVLIAVCGLIVADVITDTRAAVLIVAMMPAALAMWWVSESKATAAQEGA